MGKQSKLFDIADRQQGFFTAKQAEECGYLRSNFRLKLTSGEWAQEERGLYRLARYPVTDRPELVLWSLWSRNREDVPQGIWSHETALDIHELSDVMPSKMHMTVPPRFRRRKSLPKVLSLHRGDLEKKDIEERQGYKVTTPLRTIIDCIEEGTIADNFISQAIHQALKRGIVLKEEIEPLKATMPDLYRHITEVLNDNKI